MGNKFLSVLEVIKLFLIPFVIMNLVVYLFGALIAFNLNPMDWLLIKTIFGRVCLSVIELGVLANVPKFWDEFN
jgi:hypothetical protein